jgi:putative ABC transport system permease protein
LGNLKLFIMAICGAVTFTILLVSGNTISMSVRERIREVGILKTLGFSPGAILGIILGEAAVISLIGGLLGALLASGMCSMISHSPAANFMSGLSTLGITPVVGALSLGVALLIGLASSFVPAWGASRTTILDALRYAG